MQSLKKNSVSLFMRTIVGATFLYAFFIPPAFADEIDPFAMDGGHWMSFDHYKERTRHGAALPDESVNNVNKDDDAKNENASPVPTADNAAIPAVSSPSAKGVVVAAPARPINPPVMPGMNKGYSVQVNSTEDDVKAPVAQITNLDTQPTVELPEKNWQSAAEVSHRKDSDSSLADSEHTPLDIRMTYLPNHDIAPVAAPDSKSNHGRRPAAIAAAAAAKEASKKAPEELAACAAVDAYKKKQIEAIQSDRQTLAALQSAISQLGLQKQLSFMSGANGTVGSQAENTTPSGGLDLSAPAAATPAKN